MFPAQALPDRFPNVFRTVSIASRESTEVLRRGLMQSLLLFFVLDPDGGMF
jgi:hypothetical protein